MDISMYAGFSDIISSDGADAACRRAKELGCSSVEHIEAAWREPTLKSDDDVKLLKAAMDRYGLHMTCYSVAANLWHSGMTSDTVTETEKALMLHAERAAALGSPFLHHTIMLGVEKDLVPLESALELILPAAVRIARYANSLGVACLYEDQGMYVNGVDGFGAFYYAVKKECPYVGVCGDVGNILFADEEPIDFFSAFAGEMKHIHIKDYIIADERGPEPGWALTRGGRWLLDSVIGEGCIDLTGCLKLLKAAGYSGAFSLENCHGGDFEYGVKKGIEVITENYR